ncbi:RNA polymerase recycling motor HelD [Paenibacillus tengchongensis]|uniref:RNA polymerase recycling motor HelD n=1 Tax=Paenibacillus tengchongensis TaxID=2608684 RepID=UPI00124EC044|nr:RNA polymerase recycling motor HelD [Paenibacillus tengchongensis]
MIDAKDWRQEQEWLDLVLARVREAIAELDPQVSGLHEQVTDIRRRFWEEVTVNTSTDEDFEETFYSIKQQEALLSERERSHRIRLQRWKSMHRLLPAPYFGRIDFREDGLPANEQIYIGVSSLADRVGLDFLVYDWRTPIASMYYDHLPGDAAYETPGGRIEGTMTLKRQFQIRKGQLQHVFDTSLTIGDELLQQVLGKGADAQMKSIVATIQREQNAIIRDDHSRMLIVQGAAGSGKTSAALQRVAYLLYKNRESLRADQMVLFSPNPMFNSYVSTVLPELGEENMQQTTFYEYLEYWLGDSLVLEDPFGQIEYLLASGGTDEAQVRLQAIQFKASGLFLEALEQYATWLLDDGMLFHSIRYRERELVTEDQIRQQFYSYESSIRLANRIVLLRQWLLHELTGLERAERQADWVQEELDFLDIDDYTEAYTELRRQYEKEEAVIRFNDQYADAYEDSSENGNDEFDFGLGEKEEQILRRNVVKASFRPLRQEVKQLSFIDLKGLYRQLFSGVPALETLMEESGIPLSWPEICSQTLEKLDRGELYYEDATPFLYLKDLIEGTRTNTQVRHLFIDEAQDYSPFQFMFLRKLFPRARMTVLGDFSQAIFPQATELQEADSPLIPLFGEKDTRLVRFNRSYRSTREIVEFTKSLLPEGAGIVPFDRHGKKPQLISVKDGESRAVQMLADIGRLQAEGYDTIAVITKTAAESREAYEVLTQEGAGKLRLVNKDTLTFEKGTVVIPAYLAKGVEFDAVLIYDASAAVYALESERKLFYTACTRAMHHLQLYAAGQWTPYLEGVDDFLFEKDA